MFPYQMGFCNTGKLQDCLCKLEFVNETKFDRHNLWSIYVRFIQPVLKINISLLITWPLPSY